MDKRLNPNRPGVDGEPARLAAASTDVQKAPRRDAMRMTQGLRGEDVRVFERHEGWAYVQLEADGYVGYVEEEALGPRGPAATHWLSVPSSFAYPAADLKTSPVLEVFFGTRLAVTGTDANYARTPLGFVPLSHVKSLDTPRADPAGIAAEFMYAPYLWGGKTVRGLDCSGLVQLALNACGIAALRDTDMQEASLGRALNAGEPLQRNDLVFWKGHVGILSGPESLIHANGTHMQVVEEPLAQAITRIAAMGSEVTSIRRLQ
ncbi:MAG: C40 family peptidase [Aestuariivirgaceae bacterium]|nr:C40 family peptidase [Aestuariivirgaceae bacterium]